MAAKNTFARITNAPIWPKLAGILVIVVSGLTQIQPTLAATEINGNLVSVEWLQKNLMDPDLVILDASPGQIYKEKHIPGAINVDYFAYGSPYNTGAAMQKNFQSWGISAGKKIVLYDQGGAYFAPRLFFTLYYYNVPARNIFILDGGLSKWQAQGFAVTKEASPPPVQGTFKINTTNETVRVRLPEFITASGDLNNNVLLEALGPDWHFGEVLSFGKRGHIPNAIMLPSDDFFNADKTFKSVAEIQRALDYFGIKPAQKIHTHCGGGGAAAVPFFALKFMLNYPEVTLFIESQMGWLRDPRDLPFWTYDAPSTMRDANWLKSWNGNMLRMVGVSQISVIDVRPAETYMDGHVPFALNIPAAVFKEHIAQPSQLAQSLGQAGVNAAHEAVIISGAGLTKDAALAFVMLEKLGQKHVSIFMDSSSQWEKLGFVVTAQPTAVGAKKSPFDMSIPPTVYPGNVRSQVVVSDANRTKGLYPKVYIAAGKELPAKKRDGKSVHVPYTTLLNADGTPKAAMEIWTILSKAGVPRYAELISYGDDPGEAAVVYFILKLMGYPDIKMLDGRP